MFALTIFVITTIIFFCSLSSGFTYVVVAPFYFPVTFHIVWTLISELHLDWNSFVSDPGKGAERLFSRSYSYPV